MSGPSVASSRKRDILQIGGADFLTVGKPDRLDPWRRVRAGRKRGCELTRYCDAVSVLRGDRDIANAVKADRDFVDQCVPQPQDIDAVGIGLLKDMIMPATGKEMIGIESRRRRR